MRLIEHFCALRVLEIILLISLSFVAFGLELYGGFVLIDAFVSISFSDYATIKPVAILFGFATLIPGGLGAESYALIELFNWRGVVTPALEATIITVKIITMSMILLCGQVVFIFNNKLFN